MQSKSEQFISKLPIQPILANLVDKLSEQNRLILSAQPGAGKSTAVPLYLLENLDLAANKIVMLEPRRLAAKSIAEFLAQQLNENVGQTIGYQVRNERRVSSETRLEIVTEAVLTNRILRDPELNGTGLIIFDEFHERSIHADFGLSLCKDICDVYNEQLKLLVMSATIDSKAVSEFLDGADVIHTQGRCFPVKTEYLPKPINSAQPRDWLPELNRLILKALAATDGDLLVFLPGQAEIKRTQQWLDERLNPDSQIAVPLYGSLKSQLQQQALKVDEQGRQKIVLATNIAETSLTIANISAVVDSGWERVADYDVNSGMTRLITQRISQASAEQRQGRAGRIQAGNCYRLWTESQQQALKPFAQPEIITSDITSLRLAMAQWGVKTLAELQWLTEPPKAHFTAATQLLQSLGLLKVDLNLSAKGEQASDFNTEPRFSRLLVELADQEPSTQSLACDLVAVMMDSQFYYDQDDADAVSRILALQAYRLNPKAATRQYPIKPGLSQQVLMTAHRLQLNFNIAKADQHSLTEIQQKLGFLIALAFPDRIAKRRQESAVDLCRYQLSNGRGAALPRSNRLSASDWLAVVDLDGQKSDGRIYLASQISQADIEHSVGIQQVADYRYNPKNKQIEGLQLTRVGAITLKQSKLEKPDKDKLQACLKQTVIDTGLEILPWKQHTLDWLERVRWLASIAEEQCADWPDLSPTGLLKTVDEWLFPYLTDIDSIDGLKALDLDSLIKAQFDYQVILEIDQQAPEYYQPPLGRPVKIDYQIGQLPKVSIILQSLFGELSSPKLAWNRSQLAFELLSPARRPIQVTSDLQGFWNGSYSDVAKEMKGRYPKHRWPEKPLQEKPGSSTKKR